MITRFLTIVFLLMCPFAVFAYEPTLTHPGITEQVVEFYNFSATKKISSEQKELIIKGSTEEDSPEYRAINHFYDPIRNIGIDGERTTKSWVFDDLESNEFSWDKAIDKYAHGDESNAFVALGHILHLASDMAVPDHTRNDQHVPFLSDDLGGHSPYEDWARNNKNRAVMKGFAQSLFKKSVPIRNFSQPGEYFDFLANYSNKNFFSRDTIYREDVYLEPKILEYSEGYGYGKDSLAGSLSVLLVKKIENQGVIEDILTDGSDFSVLSSYFDRLSRQLIPAGAGLVELFFKEAEVARAAYQAELLIKQEAGLKADAELARSLSQKGFFGLLSSGFGFFVSDYIVEPIARDVARPIGRTFASAGSSIQGFKEYLSPVPNVASFAAVAGSIEAKNRAVVAKDWTVDKVSRAVIIVQQATTNAMNGEIDPQSMMAGPIYAIVVPPGSSQITQQNGSSAQGPGLVASPDAAQSSAENSTTRESSVKLIFVGNSSLGLGGGGGGASPSVQPQVLNSVVETPAAPQEDTLVVIPEIPANLLPPPAPNLSAPQCAYSLATDGCLITTTTLRFEWPAIDGVNHYVINKDGVFSTTTESAIDVVAPDFSDYLFEVVAVGTDGQTSATSTQKISVATIPVAINEVAWMGTFASSTAEWLELKNNTGHTIDLSSWVLSAQDSKPFIALKGTITPHAFYLLERANDGAIADRTADLVYGNNGTSWALNNGGENLILSHDGTTLDTTATLEDGSWPAGENIQWDSKKSMERYISRESGADPANWGTNLGYIANGVDNDGLAIEGTPGERNSVSYLVNKGQDVTSDLTLDSSEGPYIIPDHLFVAASSTLTLEPGTTLSFYKTPESWQQPILDIDGTVNAQGTAEDPVVINSIPGTDDGLILLDYVTSTSTFDHVHFENIFGVGGTGAKIEISNSEFATTTLGVFAGRQSSVSIENTNFDNSGLAAVTSWGASVSIASSTIENQGDIALRIYDGGSMSVASTTFAGVYMVAGVDGESSLSVASSTIENVAWGAFSVEQGSSLTIASTTISGVEDVAIYSSDSSVSISDSVIQDAGQGVVEAHSGTTTITSSILEGRGTDPFTVGVFVDGGTATMIDSTITGFGTGVNVDTPAEPVVVSGGEISGNDVGVVASPAAVIIDNVSMNGNRQDMEVAPVAP